MLSANAFLGISVDISESKNPEALGNIEDLLQLMDQLRFQATWAFGKFGKGELAQRIVTLGHDVAILGDGSWIGPSVPRMKFSRMLTSRVTQARSLALSIETLALSNTDLDEHLDLLVKQRIGLIRGVAGQEQGVDYCFHPLSVRFGVWRTPTPVNFPGSGVWWLGGDEPHMRKALHGAIQQAGTFHLLVDANAIQTGQIRILERFLQHARELVDQGLLENDQLARLAQRAARQATLNRTPTIVA